MISILFLISYAILAYIIITALPLAQGYNLTQADLEEGRVLELCMVDIQLWECQFLYGGPIK